MKLFYNYSEKCPYRNKEKEEFTHPYYGEEITAWKCKHLRHKYNEHKKISWCNITYCPMYHKK